MSSASVQAGLEILDAADSAGLGLRLWGGCGAAVACPSLARPPLRRDPDDVDLLASGEDAATVGAPLQVLGYAPEREGNALYGDELGHRLFFRPRRSGGPAVDVQLDLVGWFYFWKPEPSERTLSPTDLLLSKLQPRRSVGRLGDAAALLLDHEPDEQRLTGLLSPWRGWRATVRGFVDEVESFAASRLAASEAETVRRRAARVRAVALQDGRGKLDEEAIFAEALAIGRDQLQRASRAQSPGVAGLSAR